MQRYDDADKQERLKHALDAWSQIPNISDHISYGLIFAFYIFILIIIGWLFDI